MNVYLNFNEKGRADLIFVAFFILQMKFLFLCTKRIFQQTLNRLKYINLLEWCVEHTQILKET